MVVAFVLAALLGLYAWSTWFGRRRGHCADSSDLSVPLVVVAAVGCALSPWSLVALLVGATAAWVELGASVWRGRRGR